MSIQFGLLKSCLLITSHREIISHCTVALGCHRLWKELYRTYITPEAYFNASTTGKWWGGYDGHQDVILDDVREETFSLFTDVSDLGSASSEDRR